MIETLLEPFQYQYMRNAMLVAAVVGAMCAFLSVFIMLKGWSLIGDALSHAVVPGVAGAYVLGLPFSLGAFMAAGLASAAMLAINANTRLKQDAIIGVVFTGFFGTGLFIASLNPTSVSVQTIAMGNILAISPFDTAQIVAISLLVISVLALKWRDVMLTFFDEDHARSCGINPAWMRTMFFILLALGVVAALQAVGAFLVVAIIIIPGATAYLLTDRFARLIVLAVSLGTATGATGAWLSYLIDGATGGIIVLLQTAAFLTAYVFAPKHGIIAARRRARENRAADPHMGASDAV